MKPTPFPSLRNPARTTFLQSLAGLGLAGLAPRLPAYAADLSAVDLRIADVEHQVSLDASGLSKAVPFKVDWANLTLGPAIVQAYRARAIDLGAVGGIPPILAASTGLDIKIVAFRYRTIPAYTLVTAPGSDIRRVSDVRGKKIAYSAGQEQGLFVLKVLQQARLSKDQVTLVRLTSGEFQNALASRQVDAAPMAEPLLTTYLNLYGHDGAIVLRPNVQATPLTLTASAEVLKDPEKVLAISTFLKSWYAAAVWEYEHAAAWIDAYYVQNQHVSADDGKRIIADLGKPVFARNWRKARAIQAEAVDFLTAEGVVSNVKADDLFDPRFESLAAASVPSRYLE